MSTSFQDSRSNVGAHDDGTSEFAFDSTTATQRGGISGGQQAAQQRQQTLGARRPASRIKLSAFRNVQPLGVKVAYAENKICIMPNLDVVIAEIAEEAGVTLGDTNAATLLLYALVTDVYTNPYSDKFTFEGSITIPGFDLERIRIKNVLAQHVGTHYRRYARAMAPVVIQTINNNPDFYELLDRRALELGIGRHEAVYSFDGADQLVDVNRDVNARNAAARTLALTKRNTGAEYSMLKASGASGGHAYASGVTSGDGSSSNMALQNLPTVTNN